MNNFLEIEEKEFSQNFDFCLTLVQRGTTIKIITEQGKAILCVPINDELKDLITNNIPLETPGIDQMSIAEDLKELEQEFLKQTEII
jgi:hypothetical protein